MAIPNIRVSFSVPFPARVAGAGSISVLKANGIWTISNDYTLLAQHTPLEAQYPNTLVETYNRVTGLYETMSLTDMQAATQDGLPASIEYVLDGGGQPITSGIKGYLRVPFNSNIERVDMVGDPLGDLQMDIYRCTTAAFNPPTHPAVVDSITAAAKPTIVAGVKYSDALLPGWATALADGDVLAFAVLSAAVVQKATLSLAIVRTQ